MQILGKCGYGGYAVSGVFRFSLYSTGTRASNATKVFLQSRIYPAIDPRASVVPALEEWGKEGRSIKKQDVRTLIRKLRSGKRYKHALEVSSFGFQFHLFSIFWFMPLFLGSDFGTGKRGKVWYSFRFNFPKPYSFGDPNRAIPFSLILCKATVIHYKRFCIDKKINLCCLVNFCF